MSELHPIFKDCADVPDGPLSFRYDMTKPFIHEGRIYATDARIIVRGPVPEYENIPTVSEKPPRDCHTMPQWNPANYSESPVAELPDVPAIMETCSYCKGKGKDPYCIECNGRGDTECSECGHETKCKPCDGRGYIVGECASCDGTGSTEYPQYVKIGAVRHCVAGKYLRILRKHGAAVFPPRDTGKGMCVRFVVPGADIEGLLMLCSVTAQDLGPSPAVAP